MCKRVPKYTYTRFRDCRIMKSNFQSNIISVLHNMMSAADGFWICQNRRSSTSVKKWTWRSQQRSVIFSGYANRLGQFLFDFQLTIIGTPRVTNQNLQNRPSESWTDLV